MECGVLGLQGDAPEQGWERMTPHKMDYGQLSRNLPEDRVTAEVCELSFGSVATHQKSLRERKS